jgi:hypothetical protein
LENASRQQGHLERDRCARDIYLFDFWQFLPKNGIKNAQKEQKWQWRAHGKGEIFGSQDTRSRHKLSSMKPKNADRKRAH